MLFTYCPQCGGMAFREVAAGKECLSCHFIGKMAEGPMDAINTVRKRSRPGVSNASTPPSNPPNNDASVKELADRLKNMKGKSDGNVEFL
ncbi:MAG: hypothetical protein Q8P05_05740 [Candidatus Diapherotrites archaeon]|nr:hypothetical protein [Candidatus Diapherotrites archaeon]MDZ4256834.1 hypothetical protein [archaeon]